MTLRRIFLAPAWLTVLITMAVPIAIILAYSFLNRGAYGGVEQPWTIESYQRLIDPLYSGIFLRTLWISLLATALCLVLAFPLAMFIAASGKRRNLYLSLVTLPFWTSFLIRLYAWMFLLRDQGLINSTLMSLGWIHEPLPMLYNSGAVLLGLVYGFLPFAVLPLYATLERLDRSMLEAASDLGARPWTAFWRVTVPLSASGIRAAGVLVFIPCLGTYLVSDLLGGSRTVLVGNLVQNQFTTARDWPFGSAIAIALMLFAVGLLALLTRKQGESIL